MYLRVGVESLSQEWYEPSGRWVDLQQNSGPLPLDNSNLRGFRFEASMHRLAPRFREPKSEANIGGTAESRERLIPEIIFGTWSEIKSMLAY